MMSWLVNNELERRMWMKLVVVQFVVLCWCLPGFLRTAAKICIQDGQPLGKDLNCKPHVKESQLCHCSIKFSLLLSHVLLRGLVIR
jgi:hypothetical protein